MIFVEQPFEVAVRLGINLETLSLIPIPQSDVYFGKLHSGIRLRDSGPTFNSIFIFRDRVRLILDYDVIIHTCAGANAKQQTDV